MQTSSRFSTLALALALALAAGTRLAAQQPAQIATALRPYAKEWEALVAAEDARAATPEQLATIMEATRSPAPDLRMLAARSLGRLERGELLDSITPLLGNRTARVRAQAAWSVAQALRTSGDVARGRSALVDALAREKNTATIAAIAEALGRLRHADAAEARGTAARFVPLTSHKSSDVRLGAVRGLFFMAVQPAARAGLDGARAALVRAATAKTGGTLTARRARTVAASALVFGRLATPDVLLRILNDPDPLVRREAAAIGFVRDTAAVEPVVRKALRDTHYMVRYDAVRQYGRLFAAHRSCDDLMPYARDRNLHVRIAAVDLLARTCEPSSRTTVYLDSLVQTLPRAELGAWHLPAHALLALAARAPAAAREQLQAFERHPSFYVRTYAATAAGLIADTAALHRLAHDAHPNVRTSAVQGLSRLVGHEADSVYIAQMPSDDSQLLMAAAAALDSTTNAPPALEAMLGALERLTAQKRENSRDSRDALLTVIGHLGNGSLNERVRPYLQDFDPAIATRAAAVLKGWTGRDYPLSPQPLPPLPTPTFAEAVRLQRTRLTFVMQSGDTIRMRLFPFDAPTNAARFERMVRTGELDNRTLHRVEPTFVVQGGSPNANEYRGAAEFSRDEIAVPNWRGTIGLSTRGHDTGDAQIYINMIDNLRLDPLFTVYSEVVTGMAAVDRFQEGVAIRQGLSSTKP